MTHLMEKSVSLWISACGAEARYPSAFRWSHAGPVNCMECLAAPSDPEEDEASLPSLQKGWGFTGYRPEGHPIQRRRGKLGALRHALASLTLYEGAPCPPQPPSAVELLMLQEKIASAACIPLRFIYPGTTDEAAVIDTETREGATIETVAPRSP